MFRVRTDSIEKHANELIEKYGDSRIVLKLASFNGSFSMVKYLVENGAHDLQHALTYASLCGNNKPLRKGDAISPVTKIHEPSFNIYPKEYLKVVQYLYERYPIIVTFYLEFALNHAAGNGHLEMVKYLVARGTRNLDKALKDAVKYNHLSVAEYLVGAGANKLYLDIKYNAPSNVVE